MQVKNFFFVSVFCFYYYYYYFSRSFIKANLKYVEKSINKNNSSLWDDDVDEDGQNI